MISDEKQFEFVCSQVQVHNQRIVDSFKLFIQLYSAIVGGSIWLSTQGHVTGTKVPTYGLLSDLLIILVTVLTIVMVFENLRSWHGYRSAQSRLGGLDEAGKPNIPPPRIFRASLMECMMMVIMAVAAGLFCYFNPFSI